MGLKFIEHHTLSTYPFLFFKTNSFFKANGDAKCLYMNQRTYSTLKVCWQKKDKCVFLKGKERYSLFSPCHKEKKFMHYKWYAASLLATIDDQLTHRFFLKNIPIPNEFLTKNLRGHLKHSKEKKISKLSNNSW